MTETTKKYIGVEAKNSTTGKTFTLFDFVGNETYVITNSEREKEVYDSLVQAYKEKDWPRVDGLINFWKGLKARLQEDDTFKTEIDESAEDARDIESLVITVDGEPVHGVIKQMIIKFTRKGMSFEPIKRFYSLVKLNPSNSAMERLFECLTYNEHPLLEDGRFLAYKNVREDWKDIHSGTFDNSPGQVCTMPRNQVDDNHHTTCSRGLHVASFDYANGFGGSSHNRLLAVAVSPEDVVAIPYDYNNQKMRTCKYEVICEVPRNEIHSASLSEIVGADGKKYSLLQLENDESYGLNLRFAAKDDESEWDDEDYDYDYDEDSDIDNDYDHDYY